MHLASQGPTGPLFKAGLNRRGTKERIQLDCVIRLHLKVSLNDVRMMWDHDGHPDAGERFHDRTGGEGK